ncbi:MAG: phenylalanine--tRNA ligase subunit beta [Acidimicrobiia bacterium]|nr:phenylalanine--tRNA ligase subunit beta [Acidimicrobiia bacterium]
MRLLVSWLREYVALPADIDVDTLADTLVGLGLKVEDVIDTGGVPGVVTAKVVRTERPPDAAKVQRVWVDTGDGTARHVWCGAFNFAVGDVVPLAAVGTTMPDGQTISRRAILGIDSEGMLCSARDLGLGDDHTGILVLPGDLPLGVPYAAALGRRDEVVLDVEITRNRPDAWSYVGVARDLAAKLGVAFTPPTPPLPEPAGDAADVRVDIVDGDRCGRFTATVLSGIVVGPSASWMADRLTAGGMRPISNVVDVSNYVMLELGQPNHPYDVATLGGHGFRIRTATEGERLTTLDDVDRALDAKDLLICDADDRPIGLAGIMGGADTEIAAGTTTVALEMAWFAPIPIATTVSRLNLRSEASARFERGVDAYGIDRAIARFVKLLAETCPDLRVHPGGVDARGAGLPPRERTCTVRTHQVNRILGGTTLEEDEWPALIEPIGFAVSGSGPDRTVELPSWRPDSTEEVDVIEEVGRLYGYDRVGVRAPVASSPGRLTPSQRRRRRLRDVLQGLGITEVMPNPLLTSDLQRRAGLDGEALRVSNPIVADEDVLRTSLRPGLLRSVAFNASHRRPGVALFEIGHVYPPGPGELPDEYEALGVVLAGEEAPAAVTVWREIALAMGIGARIDQSRVAAGLHPTRSATLVAGRDVIGIVGEIAPEVLEAFEIAERVAVLELDLRAVVDHDPKPARWTPTSRAPSSDLDLAFVLPDDVPAEKLYKAIRQGSGPLLVGLELFDVYRGPGVPADARSLAFRLRLQAADRTLTDADVADVRNRVTAATTKLGATLRTG